MSFLTYVTGYSLAEIVEIARSRISNQNDADRGSDCEVRRACKTRHKIKSDWLLIFFTFVTKSPATFKPICIIDDYAKDGGPGAV